MYDKAVDEIVKRLLACQDGKFISEIYAKEGSAVRGINGNWVGLMIETDLPFENTYLYDLIDEIESESRPFTLVVSVEPDCVERGHGTVLWQRSLIVGE